MGAPPPVRNDTLLTISAILPAMRRVVMVTYPDTTLLDVAGPSEVFHTANELGAAEPYELVVASSGGGSVRASSGLVLETRPIDTVRGPADTLMAVGGTGVRAAAADERLVAGVRRLALRCRRVTSVCTGTFLLAEAGLLAGRRVTTHWGRAAALGQRFPGLDIDPDRIYIRDGDVWTSAGVTAGIDLALALVEDDHGPDLAREVARWLVVFVQRPGGQGQFSGHVAVPAPRRDEVKGVLDAIAADPSADLSVAALARGAGLSERHLARMFRAETGTTVADHVEAVRVDAARRLLEDGGTGLGAVARRCGFGTVETFHRAFKRRTGITPGEHRARFA
jgi:transcriptional regulator GlxA family with amidase domain